MDKNINTLVTSIITQKKLQFLESEKFHNSLFENGVLKIENKKISIIDYDFIIESFVKIYKEKIEFETSSEFIKSVNFIKKIKEDFLINGYVYDFPKLEKKIWQNLIIECNSKYECTFNDFLNSIDKKNKIEGIFNFMDAYSELLPSLNIRSTTIYDNSIVLMELSKSDAHYNIPLINILNGIKNKCRINYKSGMILLKKSLNIEGDKESLLSTIITGLSENKRNEFYYTVLEDLIEKENKLNAIFFGLSNISTIEKYECELFSKLVKKYEDNDNLILSLTSLVLSIFKSNNTNYYIFSLDKLKSFIENESTANYILNNLSQIDNCNEEKTEIITKLIKQNYFSIEKYINSISATFWYLKEFASFKKIILAIISSRPFESFAKAFHLDPINQIEMDNFLIQLLTDNSASKRFTGLDFFDQLSNYVPYKFTINILELPSIIQYKLWISLTEDFHQPKNRLVALIPLLQSNSEWVKTSFICKLEKLSEDYGGLMTKILQENLDLNKPQNIDIIDKTSKYIEVFYDKNINIKDSINEINPFYTHYKEIKLFNELFSKKMNESINEGALQNSLLGQLGVNTVQLAKGGGWRFGANENISKLSKIESSFSMPRSYFINPDMFELEKGHLIREDWNDNEFTEIKSFLENEQ